MGRGRGAMPAVATRERIVTAVSLVRGYLAPFAVRTVKLRAYAYRCITLCAVLMAHIASGQTASYTIKPLRWDEDYSYLRDRQDLPFPLSLKYLPLPVAHAFVSLGGEYRTRLESYGTPNFGLTGTPNFEALSNRLLAHADIHTGSLARVFLQIGYSDETGRKPAERPFDKGGVDLAQGFVDLNLAASEYPWRLRLGRQELAIGRFVTIRDGTAIRRTFDGVRLDGSLGAWTILAVDARATRSRPHAFDDEPDQGDSLVLLVATRKVPRVDTLHIDLLAMQRDFQTARYLAGFGHELRDSVGTRLFGSVGNWDLDAQVSHQFGRFTPNGAARLAIDSWGAAFEGGHTFHGAVASPRLALRIDAAQGDRHPKDHTLETFDLPYPNLTYLTDAAFIAPRNVWDIDPFVTVLPARTFSVTAGAQFLWRLTSHDAIYSPIGTPIVPPNTAGAFVAAQPYFRASWKPETFVELQIAATRAEPGGAVKSAGGRAQNYWTSAFTVRF
jgi:hypothetical protein